MPLPGYLRPSTLTPEENDAFAARRTSPGGAAAQTLLFGTMGSPTALAADSARVGLARLGHDPRLSAEEATARYGIAGHLKFDAPVTEAEASIKSANKRDELWRRDIIGRSDIGPLSRFGLGVAGSFIDPLSLALNFVPVLGEAKLVATFGLAANAARGAAIGAGAARGAYAGAVGGVMGEAITYGLGHGVLERDYTLGDAVVGVTAGAILGAGAGGALGAAGWRPPPSARGRIADQIRATAGEDADAALRIAQLESGLRADAKNPNSTAAGVFQFTDATWAAMGGGDKMDADLNIRRGIDLLRKNKAQLREALGREPQDFELYLAHQQGVGGALALLRDPQRGAVEALMATGASRQRALDAIRHNGATEGVTAGEFAALWARKFRGDGAPTPTTGRSEFAADFDPLPRSVAMLDEAARAGGLAKAIDDLSDGRPVEVGPLAELEAERGGGARPELDEGGEGFGLAIPAKVFDEGTAITLRGQEFPVRYALVEARDLITSHDADLIRRPDFPEALRADFDRADSAARLDRLERAFKAEKLLDRVSAEAGTPIIAPDGVVEHGQHRAILVAREAAAGSERYGQYVEALRASGFDPEGLTAPVLVRVRSQPMSGAERVRLARQMEADSGLAPLAAPATGQPAPRDAGEAATIYDAAASRYQGVDPEPVEAPRPREGQTAEEADLAALEEEVARLEALEGPEARGAAAEAEGARNPNTMRAAVDAAAECLLMGGVE